MEYKKRIIVFFTIEVGIAHITRSLAIAEELHSQGHKVIFALPKRKWGLINKTPVRVIDIPPYVLTDGISVFKAIKDKSLLRDAIKAESKIIEKYSPDVIVNDFRLSAILTSANYKLPTFYITGGAGIPYGSYIPNPGLPKLIHKLALPLTQHIIWKIKKL